MTIVLFALAASHQCRERKRKIFFIMTSRLFVLRRPIKKKGKIADRECSVRSFPHNPCSRGKATHTHMVPVIKAWLPDSHICTGMKRLTDDCPFRNSALCVATSSLCCLNLGLPVSWFEGWQFSGVFEAYGSGLVVWFKRLKLSVWISQIVF